MRCRVACFILSTNGKKQEEKKQETNRLDLQLKDLTLSNTLLSLGATSIHINRWSTASEVLCKEM